MGVQVCGESVTCSRTQGQQQGHVKLKLEYILVSLFLFQNYKGMLSLRKKKKKEGKEKKNQLQNISNVRKNKK